jgi:hypothetical protein
MSLGFILTGTIQGLWDTTLDGFTINGNDTHVSTLGAVLDSSSPLIFGDHESIANIYAGIPGSSRLNVTDPKQFQLWTCTFITDLTVSG